MEVDNESLEINSFLRWETTTANYLQFIDFGEHENQFRTPFVNSFAKNKNG